MNEHRILTTFRALDGPDDIEDQWLSARNMVMNISTLESPEQIDKDSIQEKFKLKHYLQNSGHSRLKLSLSSLYHMPTEENMMKSSSGWSAFMSVLTVKVCFYHFIFYL